MMRAEQALARLIEGNQRFVSGDTHLDQCADASRRRELVGDQEPFAIILGCSDSRVPAEIVFDQGLGDLFVIRVAGNIVAPSQIASIEFAAERFGTRLVVVLGHTDCGAVNATLEQLALPESERSANLRPIARWIQPVVEPLLVDGPKDHQQLVERAVRANIHASAEHLRTGSEILEALIREDGLVIAEAEYSLKSGRVHFFDAPA